MCLGIKFPTQPNREIWTGEQGLKSADQGNFDGITETASLCPGGSNPVPRLATPSARLEGSPVGESKRGLADQSKSPRLRNSRNHSPHGNEFNGHGEICYVVDIRRYTPRLRSR